MKLTPKQFNAYLRRISVSKDEPLEYEKVPGVAETIKKLAERYKRAGIEMPVVEQ